MIRIPNSLTYLSWRSASCRPNIGRRRRETIKHGWETLPTAASCTGERASKRPFRSTRHQIHQLSSWPHHQRHTARSPQHMRRTKPDSSAARPSSPSLGYSFRGRRPSLILTSSSLRKICISRKTGDVRLMRTSPRMMKPSTHQTYLNGSQTCRPPPTRPYATGP